MMPINIKRFLLNHMKGLHMVSGRKIL